MSNISIGELLMIIAATATALDTIINAVARGWGRKAIEAVKTEIVTRDNRADAKLEHIKELTNGGLAAVKEQLRAALARRDELTERLALRDARIDALEHQLRFVEKRKDPA